MQAFNPKDFFKSPMGKLVILITVMLVCWVILGVYLSGHSAGGTWFPTDAQLNRALTDIKNERVKYTAASAQMEEINKLRAKYNTKLATFWQVERDGAPEEKLRSLLYDTAALLEITFTRLDNVRISNKITDDLAYADLSFSFTDSYDKIISFISQIETTQPRIGWRSVTINAERGRNMMQMQANRQVRTTTTSSSSSGTTTTAQQMYRFDATVRVIRYMPVAKADAAATAKNGTAAGTKAANTTGTAAAAGTAAPANQTSQIPAPAAKPTPTAAEAAASRATAPNTVNPTTPVTTAPNAQGAAMPGMGNMQGGMGMPGMGGFGGNMGGFGGMPGGMDMQGGMGGFGGNMGGFGGNMGGMQGMQGMGGFGGNMGGMQGMQGMQGMGNNTAVPGVAPAGNTTTTQTQPAAAANANRAAAPNTATPAANRTPGAAATRN